MCDRRRSLDQERGLWVVAVLWGVPFAACAIVAAWGIYAEDKSGPLVGPAAAVAAYCVVQVVRTLLTRWRERRRQQ